MSPVLKEEMIGMLHMMGVVWPSPVWRCWGMDEATGFNLATERPIGADTGLTLV